MVDIIYYAEGKGHFKVPFQQLCQRRKYSHKLSFNSVAILLF